MQRDWSSSRSASNSSSRAKRVYGELQETTEGISSMIDGYQRMISAFNQSQEKRIEMEEELAKIEDETPVEWVRRYH